MSTIQNAVEFEALEDAIFDFVNANTNQNVSVIWDKPNVPRPSKPYVTLNFITLPVRVGADDNLEHVSGEDFELSGQRTATLSIIAYGREAPQIMINIQQGLDNPIPLDVLRGKGISIQGETGITDLSTELETGFETRAGLDVTIGLASKFDVKGLGTIGQVELEGTIDGATSTTTISE